MTTQTTDRPDRNVSRAVFAKLRSGPRTIGRLVEETGYDADLLRSRLRAWCEEGRCVGRIIGGDLKSGLVIRYRLNSSFVEGYRNIAAEVQEARHAA